jgi:AcrR family transcriptional regulator
MTTKKTSKRNLLLSAANQVVLEQGAAQLTLDAVATDAGVSKGGLLYHFPSKDALIAGMIQHSIESFERRLEEVYTSLPDGHGRWLRAFVEASFEDDDISSNVFTAMLTAVANRPDLLQPLQSRLNQWMEKATEDGVPPEIAQLVIAATNGVWLERIFWRDASHERLRKHLLDLIKEPAKKQE